LALDVLHGDERLSVVFTDVEDGDDVRMTQAGGGPRFTRESLAQLIIVVAQQLDGDLAIELRIEREEERTHPAAADRPEHFIAPDAGGNTAHRRASYAGPLVVPERIHTTVGRRDRSTVDFPAQRHRTTVFTKPNCTASP